jgi:indolepyruvate ferredoxin oxidoreductase beta subunit
MNTTQPISLLLCALGGEGGGVLSEWLIHAARAAGYPAQATSIPGVAQRTGATTYYLEIYPTPLNQLQGRRPILGLTPMPGRLDMLVSSELLETARQIGNGMTSDHITRVITSSSRILTTHEKMQMGDGRSDSEALLSLVRQHSLRHHVMDMAALTRQAGTVVSAVMLGAIAGSGALPWGREIFEKVIQETGGASAAASLRGFALGYAHLATQEAQAQQLAGWLSEDDPHTMLHTPALSQALSKEASKEVSQALNAALAQFPLAIRERVVLGHARCVEYQSVDYGNLYLERLQTVLHAEQKSDPAGTQGWACTHETARWLALWMAFDDIVRVADLKSRQSRWQRVQSEVKAQEADLLRVYDHFKPGVPEFAAMLPTRWADALMRWENKRTAKGQSPWALPLKIGTHSVLGMLALRTLAACKSLRPWGSRYAQEQSLMTQWLNAVLKGLQQSADLGLELARCGQLIKGYGSTNERGKHNLLHILAQALNPTVPQTAESVAHWRKAALKDDAGQALDTQLRAQGALARPVREQPIRWMRKPTSKGV